MKLTVLLLQRDDDRAMYAEFLRHHGFAPDCPDHVDEALAGAADSDVIVTELAVPTVSDGCAFIKTLRAEPSTRHKPIIVVTSWAWQTDRLLAREAGCDVFLTKPCLPDDLLREIHSVLAATRRRVSRKRTTSSDCKPRRRS